MPILTNPGYVLVKYSLVSLSAAQYTLSNVIGPSGAVQTVSDSRRPLFWSKRRCADGV